MKYTDLKFDKSNRVYCSHPKCRALATYITPDFRPFCSTCLYLKTEIDVSTCEWHGEFFSAHEREDGGIWYVYKLSKTDTLSLFFRTMREQETQNE